MAYTAGFTAITGATILASQWNTYGRDNILALWVYDAAGQISYSTGANALAKLAKPSVDSLLFNNNAGAVAWLAKSSVGGFHAKATVDAALGPLAIPGTSTWTAITGATVNLITSITCTIVVRGYAVAACNTSGNTIILRASIGATDDSGQLPETSDDRFVPLPYEWYKTGVTAGTRAVKFMAWANGVGGQISLARIAAYAIPE